MEINVLLILFAILTVICIAAGIRKGMLTILYGACAWVFIFWFINTAAPYTQDFLRENTQIETNINENLCKRLEIRYENSEEEEVGSGREEVLKLVPTSVREELRQSVQDSVDLLISSVAKELTDIAMKGIATILTIIIGLILIWAGSVIVNGVAKVPGLKQVNKWLGFAAGILEAILIIWTILYVAECFPSTAVGQFVLTKTEESEIITLIHDHNLIKVILG